MPPPRDDIETKTARPTGPQSPTPPRRDDIETTSACPNCARAFIPIRRQRYCSPACRQAAWRARHTDQATRPAIVVPPRTNRRAITVYQCPECDSRQLGQQWCHDCNRPCARIDLGGLCPHCDEPVAVSDITSKHTPTPTRP
jgi:hypothetical protein